MKIMSREEVFSHRKNKFLSVGRGKGFSSALETEKDLTMKESLLNKIFLKIDQLKFKIIIASLLMVLLIYYFL